MQPLAARLEEVRGQGWSYPRVSFQAAAVILRAVATYAIHLAGCCGGGGALQGGAVVQAAAGAI